MHEVILTIDVTSVIVTSCSQESTLTNRQNKDNELEGQTGRLGGYSRY